MNKLKLVLIALLLGSITPAIAGGLLTNTNQNVAFDRMLSRDASIGIDGVYSNPAGVAFLGDGIHLSLNWQLVFQSRTIKNNYPLFARNQENNSTEREFRGHAFAPVLPSIQAAYNWKNFSFQAMFGVTGGGGKCTFDNGLGSFEKIVSETAAGATGLAGVVDHALGTKLFTSDKMFGDKGTYSFNSFMRGRQYYYSLSLGTAYKMNKNLAFYAGIRGVYALSNYYGYVRDIKVGNMPLYQVLDPSKTNAADIELNCDQTGTGFTPILGIDYKLGRWNFAAKYEFKTRMRLKNEAVNQAPSIGNLADNLSAVVVKAAMANNMSQAQAIEYATQKLGNKEVVGAMGMLKNQFDSKLAEATGEFEDGKSIAGDIPALLTVGVSYNPIDPLRINAGFHYFYDRQATSYNHKEDKLKRGTVEYNAGAEFDANKFITVSAGWQKTSYGMTPEYMNDKSFVTSSNSLAAGACLHVSKKIDVNIAYFHTFYSHYKTNEDISLSNSQKITYNSDYTRNNNVFGVGVDIKL